MNIAKPICRRTSDIWDEWETYAREMLVLEMKRQQIGYLELARRLETQGLKETTERPTLAWYDQAVEHVYKFRFIQHQYFQKGGLCFRVGTLR